MSTLDNIARARQIVSAASQLAWSLYANGDLSVDQHSGIAYGLDVADAGIKAIEVLVAERDAALADAAALREAPNTAYALANTPERNQDDQWEARHAALLPMLSPDNHPGAALLAELAAARELAGLVRTCEGLPIEVRTALAAYDRAVKGRSDGNL